MGPFVPDVFSGELNYIIAIIIGFAFGFILEQAGFAASRKIVGLFYGYDFTVLKVFFTAAIVAIVGMVLLNFFGLLNLDVIFINPTFWPSAIVGGAIMGLGFVVGGFCPGTSICASFIGKIDAMFFVVGLLIGVFFFTITYPAIEGLFKAGSYGPILVYDSIGISRGLFIFLLIIIALAAFVFATAWEKKINKFDEHPEKKYYKQYYGTIAIAVLVAFILIFVPTWKTKIVNMADTYAKEKVSQIEFYSPDELAFKLIHNYKNIEIIDLRSAEEFKKNNIPTSINIPFDKMTEKEWYDYIRKDRKFIVFYSKNDDVAKKAYFIAKEFGHDYNAVLAGGFENFSKTILNFNPNDISNLNSIQGKWDLRFRTKAKIEMIELKKKASNKNKPKKEKGIRVVGGC